MEKRQPQNGSQGVGSLSRTLSVSEPVRMSLKLLIGQEGDILLGSVAVKVSELVRMYISHIIRSHTPH